MDKDSTKFLVEYIGENYYEWEYKGWDFSTWEGFGKLYKCSRKQDWWLMFTVDVMTMDTWQDLIEPEEFANAVYNYLKQLEK